MYRLAFFCGLTIVVLRGAAAAGESASERPKAEEIPLDQIWGYNLPGTRDIAGIPLPEASDLENLKRQREQSIDEIRRNLMAKPSSEQALEGIVFQREADFYTLRAVSSQLAGDSRFGVRNRAYNHKKSFPAGDELTLVFFTHPTSYYVRLRKVERQGNSFIVRYQFEPHTTPEATVHFALIPLGKLPAGKYHVEYEQMPIERKYLDAGFKVVQDASTVVCRSFSFTVFEPPTEEATPDNAVIIPLDQIWAYDMPGMRNVREIESKQQRGHAWEMTQSPLLFEVLEKFQRPRRHGEKEGPAFAVEGTGKTALKNAHAVLTKQSEAATTFAPGAELSVVFYSFTHGRYVWIDSVIRVDNLITVKYRFVSHTTPVATTHFALIPLGKLSKGTFRVDIKQLPPISADRQNVTFDPDPQRIVCDSFSFRIGE